MVVFSSTGCFTSPFVFDPTKLKKFSLFPETRCRWVTTPHRGTTFTWLIKSWNKSFLKHFKGPVALFLTSFRSKAAKNRSPVELAFQWRPKDLHVSEWLVGKNTKKKKKKEKVKALKTSPCFSTYTTACFVWNSGGKMNLCQRVSAAGSVVSAAWWPWLCLSLGFFWPCRPSVKPLHPTARTWSILSCRMTPVQ